MILNLFNALFKKKTLHVLVSAFLIVSLTACSVQPSRSIQQSRAIAEETFQSVVHKFIQNEWENLSEASKAELKTIQLNVSKYVLYSTHLADDQKIAVFRQAENYLNKVYPQFLENLQNEKLGNEKRIHQINLAPFWDLKSEIDFLNSEVKNLKNGPVVFKTKDLLAMLKPVEVSSDELEMVPFKMIDIKPEEILSLKKELDQIESEDKQILTLVNYFEQKIAPYENKLANLKATLLEVPGLDMSQKQVVLGVEFLDYYYGNIGVEKRKTILSELLHIGPKFTEEEVLKVLFKNSGPGLGKVMQQMGKEAGFSGKMSELMAVLESSGKSVPHHLVQKIVAEDSGEYGIKSIDQKPLGTGTIAQVNRALLWDEGVEKEVALRFLKPGIEAQGKDDIRILKKFVKDREKLLLEAGFEDMNVISVLIESVEKFILEETDIQATIAHQKKAFDVYSRSVIVNSSNNGKMLVEMKVPKIFNPQKLKTKKPSQLHIQEFLAGGKKFQDVSNPEIQKIVAKEMIRMWFGEALFESGYMNADLHQGNFRVLVYEEKNEVKLYLYDFGMSKNLSKDEQRAFLLVGAGAHLNSSDLLVEGLSLAAKNESAQNKKKIKDLIEKEMKLNGKKSAEDWVIWTVQKNLFVSEQLGAFARGSSLLKQLPTTIGEKQLFKDVLVEVGMEKLKKSYADRDFYFPLKKWDFVKVGKAWVKDSCQQLIQSLFRKKVVTD